MQRISSGSEWEDRFGYSRAVRSDQQVMVSGTTAIDDDGSVLGEGDAHRQTEVALEIIETALAEAGASLEDVVRTRMYVTDIDRAEDIGKAHGQVFGEIKPATSMVEVQRLIDPDMLVEIEATAIIED